MRLQNRWAGADSVRSPEREACTLCHRVFRLEAAVRFVGRGPDTAARVTFHSARRDGHLRPDPCQFIWVRAVVHVEVRGHRCTVASNDCRNSRIRRA